MPKAKNFAKRASQDEYIVVPNFIVLDEDELPEGAAWATGKEYEVRVKMVKTGEHTDGENETKSSTFKIMSVVSQEHEQVPEYLGHLIGRPRNMKVGASKRKRK